MAKRVLNQLAVLLIPFPVGKAGHGPRGEAGGRGGGGRKGFTAAPLAFDLLEDLRQRVHSEDVLGQLGKERQVFRFQTAAAQDAEDAILRRRRQLRRRRTPG